MSDEDGISTGRKERSLFFLGERYERRKEVERRNRPPSIRGSEQVGKILRNHFHVRGNDETVNTGVDSMKHSGPFSRRYFLNNKLHCIRKNFLLARLQYSSQYSLSDKRKTVSIGGFRMRRTRVFCIRRGGRGG